MRFAELRVAAQSGLHSGAAGSANSAPCDGSLRHTLASSTSPAPEALYSIRLVEASVGMTNGLPTMISAMQSRCRACDGERRTQVAGDHIGALARRVFDSASRPSLEREAGLGRKDIYQVVVPEVFH